ncbi:hypothetical protein vseg_001996 [Gypsophila vaccaria]
MQSKMASLTKSRTLIKTLTLTLIPKSSISTSSFLNQLPQFAQHQQQHPLPANPYGDRPALHHPYAPPHLPPEIGDVDSLLHVFGGWVTSQRWANVKEVFEIWINGLDNYGKPNTPNVEVFNYYLRAHLMCGSSASELLGVVQQMEGFAVEPNTASYNLVLKGVLPRDWPAAVSLLERMLQCGEQSHPDHESFNLVIGMLFQQDQTETALKYVDLTLKSGYTLSSKVFGDCVRSCLKTQRLDTLASVIEKCKAMDQNKALSPSWNMCNTLAEVAIQNDNTKLAFLSLGFMARWMQLGENARPPAHLSVNEGLVIKSLSTAARTYDSTLLDASWAILKRSLRDKATPNPETYLAKINALASLGKLPSAFSTLNELEKKHGNSSTAAVEDMLSPFTSLHPLVVACSKKGYETLDLVYFQLENLSRAEPPYKSVAAINCVILGCANIWDLDRAYQTFEAISTSFGLIPNIHSYNALMYAFGKIRKTEEAVRVFEHLTSLGVKPNAMSYSVLVDAHLVNRDPKSALAVIEAMIEAGFQPSRPTLLKVRRRSIREMDNESNDLVESIAKQCKIVLGSENRRNLLFNMEYSTEYAS